MVLKAWIKQSCIKASLLALPLFLGSCGYSDDEGIKDDYVIVLDDSLQSNYLLEKQIFDLTLVLDKQAKDKKERARIFYDLSLLYERLGLYLTSRSMYLNALEQDPVFDKAYSLMAINLAQDGKLSEAMEAYDVALELGQYSDKFVNFARGISLYYAQRYSVAQQDFEKFYLEQNTDAHRIMWLYLNEFKLYGADKAKSNLATRFERSKDHKGDVFDQYLRKIFAIILGKSTEDDFFASIKAHDFDKHTKIEVLCEAYYYLGLLHKNENKLKLARDYFRLSANTKIFGFIEYRYALDELKLIEEKLASGK